MRRDVGRPGNVGLLVAGPLAGMPAAGEAQTALRLRGQPSNDKGQWSVFGVTSAAWAFAAHSPVHLPQLTPRDRCPAPGAAADAAPAGRRADLAAALAALAETGAAG